MTFTIGPDDLSLIDADMHSTVEPGTFDIWSKLALDCFHELECCEVLSAPRSPWQRAYVERVIGSIRRECLDHVIVFA